MAKRDKSGGQGSKNNAAEKAARAGLWAVVGGALVWLLGPPTRENVFEWTRSILIAGGLALTIRWCVGEPYRIPSGSMEPTFQGDPRMMRGDRVWVNKYRYGLRWPFNRTMVPGVRWYWKYADDRIFRYQDPQRWDIVVFKSVEGAQASHNTLIKRIVGMPGERIHIGRDGKVYADGAPLELPPHMPDVYYTRPFGARYGIFEDDTYAVVPEGCYLLLGDNSGSSRDGRFWGWVPNEHLLGRVACIWWPPHRWRDFTGFSKTWWWRTLMGILGLLVFVRVFFGRSWRGLPRAPETGKARPRHFYVNRWAFGPPIPFTNARLFRGRDPRRGELVLYRARPQEDGDEFLLVGRVAGLPGERVQVEDGQLTVDGAPAADAPELEGKIFADCEETGGYGRGKGKAHTVVADGAFFVLADDAVAHEPADSRALGWIGHEALIGALTFAWWPPRAWGRVR